MANNEITMLAMDFDSNFQNIIAKAASRGTLLSVIDTLGDEHVGYPTGLDEQWLQICTTSTYQIDLINLNQIINIKEVKAGAKTVVMTDISNKADRDKAFRISKSFRIKATKVLGIPVTEDWDED